MYLPSEAIDATLREVRQLVAQHGLDLADYEPFGPEHEAFGGLAMAICRISGQGT